MKYLFNLLFWLLRKRYPEYFVITYTFTDGATIEEHYVTYEDALRTFNTEPNYPSVVMVSLNRYINCWKHCLIDLSRYHKTRIRE